MDDLKQSLMVGFDPIANGSQTGSLTKLNA